MELSYGHEPKREIQSFGAEKRPLVKDINGKRTQICAHHEWIGDVLVMYDENMNVIGREKNGRPYEPDIRTTKRTIFKPDVGEVTEVLDETTGKWHRA